MDRSDAPQNLISNLILAKLPGVEYQRLAPHLELVSLPQGKVLYRPEDHLEAVYFPNGGIVSLVCSTQQGESVEVGLIGNEGVVDVSAILGNDLVNYQANVQIATFATKLNVAVLREEFARCHTLRELLLRYTDIMSLQFLQSALCNRFHTIEQRLCRWLLLARDRAKSNEFKLTQDSLSEMMGSHRPNITVVARMLQKAGIIHYNRGAINILDEKRLKSCACECYNVLAEKLRAFRATPTSGFS